MCVRLFAMVEALNEKRGCGFESVREGNLWFEELDMGLRLV